MKITRRKPALTVRQALGKLAWTLVVAANAAVTVEAWTFIHQQRRDADKSIVGDLFGQVTLTIWVAMELAILALLIGAEITKRRSKA